MKIQDLEFCILFDVVRSTWVVGTEYVDVNIYV